MQPILSPLWAQPSSRILQSLSSKWHPSFWPLSWLWCDKKRNQDVLPQRQDTLAPPLLPSAICSRRVTRSLRPLAAHVMLLMCALA